MPQPRRRLARSPSVLMDCEMVRFLLSTSPRMALFDKSARVASGHSSGFDRWLISKQFRHQREGQSEIIVKRRKSHLNIMIVFHLNCIESSWNPGIEASEHNWFVSTAAQPFISFGVWLTQVSCCPTHPSPIANPMRQSLSYQLNCLFTQLRQRSLKLWHLSTSPHLHLLTTL